MIPTTNGASHASLTGAPKNGGRVALRRERPIDGFLLLAQTATDLATAPTRDDGRKGDEGEHATRRIPDAARRIVAR